MLGACVRTLTGCELRFCQALGSGVWNLKCLQGHGHVVVGVCPHTAVRRANTSHGGWCGHGLRGVATACMAWPGQACLAKPGLYSRRRGCLGGNGLGVVTSQATDPLGKKHHFIQVYNLVHFRAWERQSRGRPWPPEAVPTFGAFLRRCQAGDLPAWFSLCSSGPLGGFCSRL